MMDEEKLRLKGIEIASEKDPEKQLEIMEYYRNLYCIACINVVMTDLISHKSHGCDADEKAKRFMYDTAIQCIAEMEANVALNCKMQGLLYPVFVQTGDILEQVIDQVTQGLAEGLKSGMLHVGPGPHKKDLN